MGQADVMKVLEKAKKWLTSKEINKIIGINSANVSLKKLSDRGEIMKREYFNEFGRSYKQFEYKIKK